jgi:hypothetical protein
VLHTRAATRSGPAAPRDHFTLLFAADLNDSSVNGTTNTIVFRHFCTLYAGALRLQLLQEPRVYEASVPRLSFSLVAGHLSPTDAALHQPGAPLVTAAMASAAPLLSQILDLTPT